MNKPKWDRYVLDATLGVPFVFCPLDDGECSEGCCDWFKCPHCGLRFRVELPQ